MFQFYFKTIDLIHCCFFTTLQIMNIIRVFILIFLLYLVDSAIYTIQSKYQASNAAITKLAFSKNEKFFVIFQGSTLKIWHTDGTLVTSLGYSSPITALEVQLATNNILVMLRNSSLFLINSINFTNLANGLYPNSGYGNNAAFHCTGSIIYAAGHDPSNSPYFRVFDGFNLTRIVSIDRQTTFPINSQISNLDFFGDTYLALVSSSSFDVQIYNVISGNKIGTLSDSTTVIQSIKFSSTGMLYTLSGDRKLRSYSRSSNVFSLNKIIDLSTYTNPSIILAKIEGYVIVAADTNILVYKSDSLQLIDVYSTSPSIISSINGNKNMLFVGTSNGQIIKFGLTVLPIVSSKYIILASTQGILVFIIIIVAIICKRKWKLKQQKVHLGKAKIEFIHPQQFEDMQARFDQFKKKYHKVKKERKANRNLEEPAIFINGIENDDDQHSNPRIRQIESKQCKLSLEGQERLQMKQKRQRKLSNYRQDELKCYGQVQKVQNKSRESFRISRKQIDQQNLYENQNQIRRSNYKYEDNKGSSFILADVEIESKKEERALSRHSRAASNDRFRNWSKSQIDREFSYEK